MVLIIWIVAGFMLLVCSVGVFALLHFMRRNRTRYEQVGGARQCDVADLSNGMRKIKGRIVAQDELLVSPLTRGRCVFYRFKVEEQRTETTNHGGRTGTRTYWHTIINDVDAIPITVEDNTGEAAVKLRDAEVVLKSAERMQSGMFKSPPPRLKRIIEEHYGKKTKGLVFNKNMRYSEEILEDGARVVVVGSVRLKGDKASFINGEQPVIVSDKSAKELASHYRSAMIKCAIGAGALGVVMAIILVGAIVISLIGTPRSQEPVAKGPEKPAVKQPNQKVVDPLDGKKPSEKPKVEKKEPVLKVKTLPAVKGARNMITLCDLSQDVVHGGWSVKKGELHCETQGLVPRVQIPYAPPNEYDFMVTFSQKNLRNGISLIMPTPQGDSFFFAVGAGNGGNFALFSDPIKEGNKPGLIEPKSKYTTTVRVRQDRVQALIGDLMLVDHPTNFADLKIDEWRRLNDRRCLGVACDDPTVFHRIDLVEISGPGKLLR